MSRFFNPKYSSLEAYVPGEQPRDKRYIKLNTNESPFPPSKRVTEALGKDEIENLRLYPDPECTALRDAIAEDLSTKKENIFVSNGSDDILNFAFMSFGADGAIFPDITYGFYKVYAALHRIDYISVPLDDDFKITTDKYLSTNKFTVIANPNAPTGIFMPLSEIEKIVSSNPSNIVLVDEAYVDFGAESAVSLVPKYDNLLVVRTFSKSRNLAGARLGYAIGHKDIISDLEMIKYSTNPYSINRMTLIAGIAAIQDTKYFNECCDKIIEARQFTTNELISRGFTVLPSSANFVFASSDRISGEEFYQKLRENGILVRHFSSKRISSFNRITIGTLDEMKEFIRITDKILNDPSMIERN